jgi:hypothetical protein
VDQAPQPRERWRKPLAVAWILSLPCVVVFLFYLAGFFGHDPSEERREYLEGASIGLFWAAPLLVGVAVTAWRHRKELRRWQAILIAIPIVLGVIGCVAYAIATAARA